MFWLACSGMLCCVCFGQGCWLLAWGFSLFCGFGLGLQVLFRLLDGRIDVSCVLNSLRDMLVDSGLCVGGCFEFVLEVVGSVFCLVCFGFRIWLGLLCL